MKYNPNGKPNINSTENYYYEYLLKHKEDIAIIKSVAVKIKSLGFDKIIYGEKLDFSDIEYELDTLNESDFEFLENIEILPTYNSTPIKYRTNGSCYCMTIRITGYGYNKDISSYNREIELNSLVFDPNRLPDELTKETTIGVIKKLAAERKKEYQMIRDSVDMSISIDDLLTQYNRTKETIEKINSVKNKKEFTQILHNISREITELRLAILAHENVMMESSKIINKDKMETEKKLYLKRREWTSMDTD